MVSNLPLGSQGPRPRRSKAHLPTSAPFRARPTRAGIRPVPRDHRLEQRRCPSRVPVAFRPPASASWASCPAEGFRPSHDRPTGPEGPDPTGFPRSTHTRYDRGGRPLYPEASGVHTTGVLVSGRRLPPLPAARPYHPGPHPVFPGFDDEASSGVHSRSPVRSSPRPVAPPDGTGALGLLPELRTPTGRTRRRTSGRGPISNTDRELRIRHRRPPICEFTRMRDLVSHPQTSDSANCQAAAGSGCGIWLSESLDRVEGLVGL